MFFCNTSIVNLYIRDMKYLLGIILIGIVASCGNDSPEWIFRDGMKMNKSTGDTYRLRNGKWIKIETYKNEQEAVKEEEAKKRQKQQEVVEEGDVFEVVEEWVIE